MHTTSSITCSDHTCLVKVQFVIIRLHKQGRNMSLVHQHLTEVEKGIQSNQQTEAIASEMHWMTATTRETTNNMCKHKCAVSITHHQMLGKDQHKKASIFWLHRHAYDLHAKCHSSPFIITIKQYGKCRESLADMLF